MATKTKSDDPTASAVEAGVSDFKALDVALPPELSDAAPSVVESRQQAELPQPDLVDARGRLRRLSISLILGSVVAAITYAVALHLVESDPGVVWNAYRFVYYVTALLGGGAFAASLAYLTHRDKKRWRDELAPSARVLEK